MASKNVNVTAGILFIYLLFYLFVFIWKGPCPLLSIHVSIDFTTVCTRVNVHLQSFMQEYFNNCDACASLFQNKPIPEYATCSESDVHVHMVLNTSQYPLKVYAIKSVHRNTFLPTRAFTQPSLTGLMSV